MTRLYLIRHAEAEGNLYRIAQGQANSNLTDRGWRQVRALERRFADIPIDAVYASDLYRTCATASAVYKPKGLPLHRERTLREIGLGVWEHRAWGEIYRRWPEEMEHFSRRPDLWRLEGAEDPRAARARVLDTLRRIAAENAGRTVAVFTHGYVLRMTLSYLQGYDLDQIGRTPTGDNTAVSLVEAEGEDLRVVFRDDNSHLKTPEYLAGEREARRANGLEVGLWFAPLDARQQGETVRALAAAIWPGEHLDPLLADAADRETLAGYLGEEPVGLVQMEPGSGWVSLLGLLPEHRHRSLGVQLLGQAVQRIREAGGETLRAHNPKSAEARSFCETYGFRLAPDGRTVEKRIAFDPEFVSP